ncbi:MAG: transglycosylase domain-containing protein [Caulobacteraceae bacterium]
MELRHGRRPSPRLSGLIVTARPTPPDAQGPTDPPFGRRGGPTSPPRPGGPLQYLALAVIAVAGIMVLGAAWFQVRYVDGLPDVPSGAALWQVRRSPGITFVDRDGAIIASRGARYGAPVSLAALPRYVPLAFLGAEDRRYYQHGAVDLRAIARAARADLVAGRAIEGGSTLAQQLARTLFLTSDPTFRRKIQEAVMAQRLESRLGKSGVLQLYLNRTYFGDGAYGLDAASRIYFGKSAEALTISEAATLAALPNAPTRLALTNDMDGAWARARKVLAIMTREHWITPDEEQAALASPPRLVARPSGEGGWGYVFDDAEAEADSLSGGATNLVVHLTVDPTLQKEAEGAVAQAIDHGGKARGASEGALIALAPDGAILAMVGGLDHDKSAYNRATQARRQPGSAFKPFVYGAAIEQGVLPTDVRDDAPISVNGWTPVDYGHRYLGPVTVAEALAQSINTVAVRLALQVGPEQVAAFARLCGLEDIPAHPGPSIALGAYEVSLLNIAGAYQVFQDGGERTTPYLISRITTARGDVIFSQPASARATVLDPLYASRMVRMMEGVVQHGTGMAANIGRPEAGKTGTSENWRDAWFIGFTPDLLTAVWVGNDADRPMAKVEGGSIPARIWAAFMTGAEKGKPPADFSWLVPEPPPAPESQPFADVSQIAPDSALAVDQEGGTDAPVIDEPSGGDSMSGQQPPPPPPDETEDAGDEWSPPPGRYGPPPYPPPRAEDDERGPPADWRPPPPPPDEDGPPDQGEQRWRY